MPVNSIKLDTVNPLLSPPPPSGGLFISSPFDGRWGGLIIETGGLYEKGGAI